MTVSIEILGRIVLALVTGGMPASRPAPAHDPVVVAQAAHEKKATHERNARHEKKAGAAEQNVAPDARALVDKLQRFYEHTKDFQADFTQRYDYKTFHRVMNSTGHVAFRKPGLMRWDYAKPRSKSFVVDGHDLWIWTPADNVVVRRKGFTTNQLSVAVTFLFGKGHLADAFKITRRGKNELVLDPLASGTGTKQVIFEIDPKTGQVKVSTVIDPQGNENRITFSNVKLDTGIPAKRFVFTPPPGAQVQEMTSTGIK